MSNQKYFDVPWAFAGDQTVIPDPLQTGGTVSFTEGWNYNYQRDLATDPAALPIDRATTNYLFNVITAAIAALQSETVPEFILASQNGGTAIAYGPQAVVLYSSSGNAPFVKYVNITGTTNSNTPSASDPLGSTTGWQVVCDPIATSAQAAAGTNNASIMTPLLVAQQTALRALLAGNSSQVFNVGPATALTHAAEAAQVQQSSFNYAGAAGGTANALTATLAPAPSALTDDLVVVLRVGSANTGATTLNVNSLGAIAVVGQAHAALQGGELIANGFACFAYSTALTKFVLLWATGGAEQVGNATQSQHAVAFGQIAGTVGSVRNLVMYNGSPSATATLTADEIIVETALGGLRYCLSSFSAILNIATVGANGMDTGSAPTTGFLGIYAIYNPTTQTAALLATNATSAFLPSIYAAGHMPSGYTASALVAVWQTNSSALLSAAYQQDRRYWLVPSQVLNTSSPATSMTAVNIGSAVPKNAKFCDVSVTHGGVSSAGNVDCAIATNPNLIGSSQSGGYIQSGTAVYGGCYNIPILTSQTIYYQCGSSSETLTLSITSYSI